MSTAQMRRKDPVFHINQPQIFSKICLSMQSFGRLQHLGLHYFQAKEKAKQPEPVDTLPWLTARVLVLYSQPPLEGSKR